MKNLFLLCLCLTSLVDVSAQGLIRKVLFLGNSYTYVNNLPLLVTGLAGAAGDSMQAEMNTPGGYTLGWEPIDHATDPTSLGLIANDTWDFVVLQEQSQIPSIPALRDSCMFPGATVLRDAAKASDPCTQVLFFLTWGRQFGGMQCFTPNYCSADFTGFGHMQDSLSVSYKMIADSLDCPIAPVGEAWRFVINNYGIVLHEGDQSHPNLKGSYLAACVFYGSVYSKPATGNSFTAGLHPDTALILQQAADSIVFGYASLWNGGGGRPRAAFSVTTHADTLFTHNQSLGSDSWWWIFGDGSNSVAFEPVHAYAVPGEYTVILAACNACDCDTVSHTVTILPTSMGPAPAVSGPSLRYDAQSGTLTVSGGAINGGVCELYDLSGRRLLSAPLHDGMLRTGRLRPGIYLVRTATVQGKIAVTEEGIGN